MPAEYGLRLYNDAGGIVLNHNDITVLSAPTVFVQYDNPTGDDFTISGRYSVPSEFDNYVLNMQVIDYPDSAIYKPIRFSYFYDTDTLEYTYGAFYQVQDNDLTPAGQYIFAYTVVQANGI